MGSQKTKSSITAEEQRLPITGIPDLDRHIDYLAAGSLTAAFVMLDIVSKRGPLGEAIKNRLQSQVEKYTDHAVIEKEIALMGEAEHAMEVSWWIGFWQGIRGAENRCGARAAARRTTTA